MINILRRLRNYWSQRMADKIEQRLMIDQDATMRIYWNCGAVRSKDDHRRLHMFFSPWRVPVGLTNEEVRICISLYPLRKLHQEMYVKGQGIVAYMNHPMMLPKELNPMDRMTRFNFNTGIEKFIADVTALLASEIFIRNEP